MIGLGLQNSNKNRLFKLIKVYKIEKSEEEDVKKKT